MLDDDRGNDFDGAFDGDCDGESESEIPPIDPALDREYNLRARHPERSAVYAAQAQRSALLRSRAAGFREFSYASGAKCLIDFLPAPSPSTSLSTAGASLAAPLFVFIHGGFWRALDLRIFTFLATPWLERGVHCAFIGYDLVPDVSVRGIVRQTSQAMGWLRDQAAALNVDADRMLVAGHSAGAHLGACVLDAKGAGHSDGWHAAAFIGLSGIYDLLPLRHTNVNADIRLPPGEARALSPMWQPAHRPTPHLLAVGGLETEGFRDQSKQFAQHLTAEGCAAQAMLVEGRTHFDILDEFADPTSALFRKAFAMLPV